MGKGQAAGRVGSDILSATRQSPGRVGSGPRKVTRGQLWADNYTYSSATLPFTRVIRFVNIRQLSLAKGIVCTVPSD